jgi:hypothetical protein
MPCYHMLFMHGKLDDMHQGMTEDFLNFPQRLVKRTLPSHKTGAIPASRPNLVVRQEWCKSHHLLRSLNLLAYPVGYMAATEMMYSFGLSLAFMANCEDNAAPAG